MSEIFFSCQPVFDGKLSLWGSELLFREGLENKFPSIDEDTATSRVLSANFLASNNLTDNKRYIVSFSESALLDEIPFSMPAKNLIIFITDECQPTPELLKKLNEYRAADYQILMDGKVFKNAWRQYLDIANIFSISMEREDPVEWADVITSYPKHTFLARKVEKQDELTLAQQFGFSLFQGYFFEKPHIVRSEDVAPSVMALLDICIAINRNPHDIDGLTSIISKDVSLLYKVIASANILAKTNSGKITNPRQAVIYLGIDALRRLVSLLIMSNMNHQESLHLQSAAMLRACFLQKLTVPDNAFISDEGFIVGAFSFLDAMLSKPMEDIVTNLDLSSGAKLGLVGKKGIYGSLLMLCRDIEHANWDGVARRCLELDLKEKQVLMLFEKARAEANELTASMQV